MSMPFIANDISANVNIEIAIMEIHTLSYFYHWGREECWNTPCSQRGVFVDKIKQQIKAENSGTSSSPKKSKYRESR